MLNNLMGHDRVAHHLWGLRGERPRDLVGASDLELAQLVTGETAEQEALDRFAWQTLQGAQNLRRWIWTMGLIALALLAIGFPAVALVNADQSAGRVLDLPVHDPHALVRIRPQQLVGGRPAGCSASVCHSRYQGPTTHRPQPSIGQPHFSHGSPGSWRPSSVSGWAWRTS
jgi:hypothetical protein